MDIKLVLRQSTVYLASLIATIIPIFTIKYWINRLFPEASYWFDVLIIAIAVTLFPVLRDYFYRFANKYLFTSLYDARQIISDLTDKLSSTLEAKKIYKYIVASLGKAFHSKFIAFLEYDPKKNEFKAMHKHQTKLSKLVGNKQIYRKYLRNDKIIVTDEFKGNHPGKYKQFISALQKKSIEVVVPMTVEKELVGVMIFGPKESGDIYNSEDLDLLKVVGSQSAIALENAMLYEETKQFNIKLTKEVEEATRDLRQANEELKKLDKAKSDFISIASHQLRTPLTVIKGYGSMMLEGSFGEIRPKIKENVKKIYESNERLITLVEDLLNISRIESGRLQFNFENISLTKMVESVTEELKVNAEKKGLKMSFKKPAEKLPDIKMDKTKIRQVVINMIDNAIKYTDHGRIDIWLEKKGSMIKFCVEDTGMGIRETDLPNLFKKFSRGEETSIVHTEGTGLGLYVGKMMIEAHNGRVWAESDGEDKGSRFCFELPIKKMKEKE